MTTDTRATAYKARLIAEFINAQYELVQSQRTEGRRPLMVSMQGPQGAGKSTLAAALIELLETGFGLKTAVASLDDFYLDYNGLKSLAAAHPSNALLSGRGPPGTHDVPLLSRTLPAIRASTVESLAAEHIQLPIFDKSLNGGYGDRSTTTVPISSSVDVFVLEGWSLGFEPSSSSDLEQAWKAGRVASQHPLSSMQQINDNLTEFSKTLHRYFDIHIAIRPETYDYVYSWRLEQELNMKKANGGKGMSDEDVRRFVDRYMPCYELYGHQKVGRPSLVLEYGKDREVVGTDTT